MALMGTGIAKGENRALEAAQRAISSPLLEETSIEGAKGVLINISGGRDLALHEVAEAARIIQAAVDPDANIITGMVIDEALEEEMKVTVIATGFRYGRRDLGAVRRPRSPPPRSAPPRRRWPPPPPGRRRPRVRCRRPSRRPRPSRFRSTSKVLAGAIARRRPERLRAERVSIDDYEIPTILRKNMD